MNVPLATISVVAFHDVTIHQDPTNASVKKGTETMEQTAYVRNAPFKRILKVNVSHVVNFEIQHYQAQFLLTIFNKFKRVQGMWSEFFES